MSAQFCLAVALTQRKVLGSDLKRFADPSIQPLIQRSKVLVNDQLGTRAFILEIDLTNGQTLRHASSATAEPFNWDRDQTMDNLRAMQDELPFGAAALEQLGATVLAAESKTVADIVSACIVKS